MKLVRMPRELLHVESDDLAALGVNGQLIAGLEAYLPRATDDEVGVAILAPADAGTRALLMVLARHVGIALRNDNIRLRDEGGEVEATFGRLCYLPGSAVAEAFQSAPARESLGREGACFVQDLESAWAEGVSAPLDPKMLLELLDLRLARSLPTYVSADPAGLPAGLAAELLVRLRALETG